MLKSFFKLILLIIISLGLQCKCVIAQEINNNIEPEILENRGEEPSKNVESSYATGNWNGIRANLEEHGITLNQNYTNDTLLKLRGGLNSKVRMRSISLAESSLTADTEKMKLWKGGTFFVLGQNVHGHSVTNGLVGDLQIVSSIDSPNLTQLGEYWYKQNFKDKVSLKIGKQDANNDFDVLKTSADFMNSSFTLIPMISMPTYPDQGVGVSTIIEPVKWFNVKAGFFEGDPDSRGLGIDSFFNNNDIGYVTMVEAGLKPVIKNHPGNYLVGYWFHSGNFEEIVSEDVNPRTFPSSTGLYTTFEQMVYKENHNNKDDSQGLHIQGQFGWAPSNRSEISRYYGASCTYQGLIPKRDDDILGFGMALANLSSQLKQRDNLKDETALELFYKIQLKPWLALQPDMQFIFNPGGDNKNAFVMGIRTIINF